VGRVDRFYVECQDCGSVVLDSARENIPAEMPEHAEAMADTAILSHAKEKSGISINPIGYDGPDVEERVLLCNSFDVVIQCAGEPYISPTADPNLNVDVILNE